MSPEPQPDAQSDSKDAANAVNRDRLPFEPTKSRKKPEKKTPTAPVKPERKSDSKKSDAKSEAKKVAAKAVKSDRSGQNTAASMSIPDAVSRRMVRRMALFCGIPSALGISTFFVSYFVITHDLVALPNAAVVLVSMGFFGLGVVGLSYGVLSASWDEAIAGSALGWSEFTTNLGRMTEAWRSAGKKP
ncbi:PAM68 family protein [Leptolyngbya sp. FACHB-671]|uniref:PAM68 family protein n=1 Tax=Leptolyngbya sp. FACHB-671 TaxID=2692812 RepID=UPI0016874AFA|nr:PAM68 family protein [Leptolyngbya sp. FACHB-671]MBD2071913.1 PAM68 family protein [Leptolyngbya sp. FACHB-671]